MSSSRMIKYIHSFITTHLEEDRTEEGRKKPTQMYVLLLAEYDSLWFGCVLIAVLV